jgi:hypothetical protein
MAINISRFLQFLFWIKLVPVRRRRHPIDSHKKLTDDDQGCPENEGWELDFYSVRYLLLLMAMLGADAVYMFFTVSCVGSQIDLFNICILIFKILNMTTFVVIPWQLGPAVCQLGERALPMKLSITKRQLLAAMGPIPVFLLGLMCIHVHEVAHYPQGAIPVVVSAGFAGFSFMGMLCLLYAWLYDFRQTVKLASSQPTISVAEADEFLIQFDQLKNAIGTTLFVMLAICQITQIFSIYNIYAGSKCNCNVQYFCMLTNSFKI